MTNNNIPTKGNTMRVSELQVGQGHIVERPNSDAYADFSNDYTKHSFIEGYGDVEIVQDGDKWRVPEFEESRKAYCAYKAKVIAKWGSE